VTRKRSKLDFYPTAGWAADVLWRRLPMARDEIGYRRGGMAIVKAPLTWAEPCVGAGDIARPGAPAPAWTNDVDRSREATYRLDATNDSAWEHFTAVDWIVTNPPFKYGLPILERAIRHARVGAAFLLRLTFLEPTMKVMPRAGFLREHPPTRMLVLPRISFDGSGGTDSVTCAWMVWCKVPGLIEPGVEVVHPSEKAAA
jgi:hypothetical protein